MYVGPKRKAITRNNRERCVCVCVYIEAHQASNLSHLRFEYCVSICKLNQVEAGETILEAAIREVGVDWLVSATPEAGAT